MTIDLNALSGRIKAEEGACDVIREKLAGRRDACPYQRQAEAGGGVCRCDICTAERRDPHPLGDRRHALRVALEEKEKWLREARTLYQQEWAKRSY